MKYYARLGDKTYECTLDAQNGDLYVEVDGRRYHADLRHIPQSHTYSLLLDGRSYEFALHKGDEKLLCELTIREGEVLYDLNGIAGKAWQDYYSGR